MMTKVTGILGGLSAVALTAAAATVMAQARAPAAPARAAPAAPLAEGPAIPGLCVMSMSGAISQSTVGQYVASRLKQIGAQVDAELSPEKTALESDVRAFNAAKTTLDAATVQSRGQALQTRINAFSQKAETRQREVQATEQKAVNRIAQELDPVVQNVYQQRHCSVLFDRERGSVISANRSMDLTAEAITGLNAKIQQFAFDREHLDTGAAAAPAR